VSNVTACHIGATGTVWKTDICEPQVPRSEQKDQQIQFSDLFIQVSMEVKQFLILKQNKLMENEFIDLLFTWNWRFRNICKFSILSTDCSH